jgi:hypothetical protein
MEVVRGTRSDPPVAHRRAKRTERAIAGEARRKPAARLTAALATARRAAGESPVLSLVPRCRLHRWPNPNAWLCDIATGLGRELLGVVPHARLPGATTDVDRAVEQRDAGHARGMQPPMAMRGRSAQFFVRM